jgi:thiamine pyrophosphokinase
MDQVPDELIGDFDSIRPNVKEYYRLRGSSVHEDGDQYATDFGKSMRKALKLQAEETNSPLDVVVLASLTGRVDQAIGIFHEMFREAQGTPLLRIWLVSDSSLSFLLPPGISRIHGLRDLAADGDAIFTENVGILPLYGPATITTSGLEWDVSNWETKMGTIVSTSNHVRQDEISIETNEWVLFTVETYGTAC